MGEMEEVEMGITGTVGVVAALIGVAVTGRGVALTGKGRTTGLHRLGDEPAVSKHLSG